ncbi:trypsin domain-containing protein [Ditylenchus destructor]|uniref:Trypsin domain-containing protein n=1 Tax=Ditylenchus destructor TaxID=166010 RepID=A0AAD4QXF7_9BILA|nr:trypsin domain-containing protein [Ditylenchus destructor]
MKICFLTTVIFVAFDIFHLAASAEPEFECGISEDPPSSSHHRVINGTVATKGQLPWIAFIPIRGCTASIISRNYILTAGHCAASGHSVTVSVGVADEKDSSAISIPSAKVIRHPGYRRCHRVAIHDITIIKLSKSLNFTKNVRPLCLKKSFKETEKDVALISGYGAKKFYPGPPPITPEYYDGKLRWGTSKFVLEKTCRRDYKEIEECLTEAKSLCGKGIKEVDVYHGDSGSPISIQNPNRADGKRQYMQVGICSFGDVDVYQGKPAVYARVSEYCDWITETTEGEVTCQD